MSSKTPGRNVLGLCNNEFWRSPKGKTGKEAELIFDLKCLTLLETFSIINGFGGIGTKRFSLYGSTDIEGPWTELHQGELTSGREMTDEVM